MNVPQAERLTEDDRSQAASEQFNAVAWANHRARAVKESLITARVLECPGCGDSVLSGVYCCPSCESAHQRRMVRGVR